MECSIRDVTPGVPRWPNSPLLLYGNIAYVRTVAALCPGEIPRCLDTDPEFQHRHFQQWYSELCPTSVSRQRRFPLYAKAAAV